MPRPKPRPEERRRSSKACDSCKVSKIKCDARTPCTACTRRGHPSSCIYASVDGRRRASRRHGGQSINRSTISGRSPVAGGIAIDDTPMTIILDPTLSTTASTPIQTSAQSGIGATRGTSLSGPSHDRVIDGETASSSFLQYLRETLRPYVGSISFTEGTPNDLVPSSEQPDGNHEQPLQTTSKMRTLVDNYHEATSGLLDLFPPDELGILISRSSHRTRLTPLGSDTDLASLDVAIAIGAQVHGASADRRRLSAAYFCCGRQVAFDSMLGSQSLSMIRLFTLMAIYMIGACQRDTASMYLGVAAKAAVVLSLHRSRGYEGLPKQEAALRVRFWNSLRNVDILSSFIFGRPTSLPPIRHKPPQTQFSMTEKGSKSLLAFDAVTRSSTLLEEIVDQLSCGKILHVPTAEHLLARLRSWNNSLSDHLRSIKLAYGTVYTPTDGFSDLVGDLDGAISSQSQRLSHDERLRLTGSLHVSCVYYFAVILITRPFLIAYLLSRLRGRAPDQLIPDPAEASDVAIKNSTVSKMAQVCVSAAIHTAETCAAAKSSGFEFGNLCLLKAWLFGAGLVLGFSKFAGEPRKDIDESFDSVCDVLETIATTSRQAKLYREILETLKEAILKWHNRVRNQVKRTVQHYIDQILHIESGQGIRQTQNPDQPSFNAVVEASDEPHTVAGRAETNPWSDSLADHTPRSSAEVLQHLGFGDLSSDYGYDDMFFNFEPFEKLFYSVE